MAYTQLISILNAKAGFRGAGLIPFDPQIVISKLDIRIRTPVNPPRYRQCMGFSNASHLNRGSFANIVG